MTTPSGTEMDVSELTLVNTETGALIVLVLNKPTDSPDSIRAIPIPLAGPVQAEADIAVASRRTSLCRPKKESSISCLTLMTRKR